MAAKIERSKIVHNVQTLNKRIESLEAAVEALLFAAKEGRPHANTGKSIHNIEEFNGEVAPPINQNNKLQMGYNDKLTSARNLAAVLNPKLKDEKTGRHSADNISAICGFDIDEPMMNDIYEPLEKTG